MSSEFEVSDDVRDLMAEIIAKYNWGPVSEVKYYPGTELGDGYASKHVAVDIVRASDTLKLFVKYALNIKQIGDIQMDQAYINEAYFYDVVYPIYNKFLRGKGFYKGFENVPKCFGTSVKNVIALENIKDKGYTLFDRKKIMNDQHICIVLKAFARFHATSFAFKDQKKNEYEELVKNCSVDIWENIAPDSPMRRMFRDMINDALSKLDSEKDSHILEKCDPNVLTNAVIGFAKNSGENPILIKGDCWCNNIMFLYEKDDKENPIDVVHVDWQMVQVTSLVHDISYFFFTIASPEALNNLDYYLKLYHSELSERIKKLGSDPDVLYPYSAFEKDWKSYCKYGFAMSFMIFKGMLVNQDEVPRFEDVDFENTEKIELFSKFKNEEEYLRRVRILADFCIKRNYI